MSLKRNILASYISQLYVTLIGIVMVPIHVRFMGAEAYGLVGFFAMLQAWFQLLDMGLTPTLAREVAQFRGGAIGSLLLRRLLRAMESFFVGVALMGCIVMMIGAGTIATNWLKVQQLSLIEVQNSIILISIIISLRWVSGLYRGAITGFEQLVWLSGFNSIMATARFVMVIPYFIYVGTSPTEFFCYQLVLALIEAVVLVMQTYRLLPAIVSGQSVRWEWSYIRGSMKFSATISFASFVWVMATQADKLMLSKLLSLTEYGYFTLTAVVAGGVVAIANPISGALLPRLTKLSAEGNQTALTALYRSATQLVLVMAVPAILVLAFFADKILWVWTGDAILVHKVALVLTLYAVGSGISVIAAFPYYLQYAKGNLRLHLIGSFLFISIFIPALIFSVEKLGMVGAGATWLAVNLIYFMFWVPVVYRSFAPGLYWPWLMRDVVATSAPAIFCAWIIFMSFTWSTGRLAIGFQLCAIGVLLFSIAGVSSNEARSVFMQYVSRYKEIHS
jgi:O-antigen/teichoic acid export membrane protein